MTVFLRNSFDAAEYGSPCRPARALPTRGARKLDKLIRLS